MSRAKVSNNEIIKASILIPCRNEVRAIEDCLKSIFAFEPPEGGFEVIVIDGMSDDGTKDVLLKLKKKHSTLVIADNPQRTVPYAMNIGIRMAKGEYIVRADVRCIHPKSYLVDLISLSEETGADNVGGILIPVGKSYFQKGIAASYNSVIAMGGALRQRDNFVGETDAVYGGCFRRKRLIEIGLYDESMVRNQDDELSFRLRKGGGKIFQSSKIRVKYYTRKNLNQLSKQFLQYGFWKVFVMKKHPKQISIRHLAPAILVASLCSLGLIGFLDGFLIKALFWLMLGGYLLCVFTDSVRVALANKLRFLPVIFGSIITVHVSFGTGFLIGLFYSLFKGRPELFRSLSR